MAVVLKVNERQVRPRSIKKELRLAGQIPAVIYGNQEKNTAIAVNEKELMKAIKEHGQNAVYTLEVAGRKIPTLIFDQQQDTFNRQWVHVEFLAVDMKEKTELEADIVLKGTPKGVKVGGELTQNLYTVVVSATPDKLPDVIEVDVTGLEIGDAITVADIKQTDFEIIADQEEQVAAVVEAKVFSEEDEITGEEVQPEVIGEKEE
ncbi:50S ribosomal protein L25/general stress protein Ctc [Vagococcus coleopterorum]|uniref:Large ribosomal subunit protein bL25 n=1 Tax=Vagococcus coleopterorum TaxID=2714946 RepID=A0A6G8AM40_9ENTE|nr:50S ribosomal protein L25/general stress protein Ctc [Vagococcus coleopterorum]QIL46040.1 50S ribosomal protein L25/general stress protein Ctc [Vagococcus coleopterorum]